MTEVHRTGPRIHGVRPEEAGEPEQRVFERQARKWGHPLVNHTIYARCPKIFQGAQGMWRGLDASGRIERSLAAILNRRVALLNGCDF